LFWLFAKFINKEIMGYVLKKAAAGAGDATAANQILELVALAQIDAELTALNAKALLGIQSQSNTTVQVFTAATAAATAILLNNYLQLNSVYVISITSSQSALSHDLFLTSTPV